MNTQKGFIPVVVVIVIAVLAVVFTGVAVYYETQKDEANTTTNTQQIVGSKACLVDNDCIFQSENNCWSEVMLGSCGMGTGDKCSSLMPNDCICENGNCILNTNSNTSVSNTNTIVNINSSANINTAVEEVVDCTDGWSTYTNEQYGYIVMHPPTATIILLEQNAFSLSPEEVAVGLTFAEKFADYGAELCVSIKLEDSAYVNIAAPENYEAGVICHRSGVGVIIDQVERSDSLEIEGVNYNGTGNIYISEDPTTGSAGTTLMYKNETNYVTLIDETSIEYGSTPAEDILYTDYEDLRDTLFCIMESFTSI